MSFSLQSVMSLESILTMRMPSSCSRNLSATETFSSFCERKVCFLLCFGNRLPDSVSMRAISRNPSDKSVSRLPMNLSTVFRCSLAQRVNVFCWMRFHCASSAKSRSVATITSSSFSCASQFETTGHSAALPLLLLTCSKSRLLSLALLTSPPATFIVSFVSSSFFPKKMNVIGNPMKMQHRISIDV